MHTTVTDFVGKTVRLLIPTPRFIVLNAEPSSTPSPALGQEFQAVVEFAPAQKIPSSKSKPRVDARQGTIDNGELHLDIPMRRARQLIMRVFSRRCRFSLVLGKP